MFIENSEIIPNDKKIYCSIKMKDYLVKCGYNYMAFEDNKYVFFNTPELLEQYKKAPFWLKIF